MTILSGGKFLKNEQETLQQANIKPSLLIYLKSNPSSSTSTTTATSTNTTTTNASSTTTNANQTQKEDIEKVQQLTQPPKENRLDQIRRAAIEMAKRNNGGQSQYEQYHFVLEDQNGNKIHLPEMERESLVIGMVLQKKSLEFLKRNQYSEAYECLQVADAEFRKVSPQLITMIDNYATLLIDIVWCMFKLQDPNMMYDAIQRLQLAENILVKSHGPNFERLLTIQRGAFTQRSLYCKLYLLKGIICYEMGDLNASEKYLMQSSTEYNKLVTDPNMVEQLIGMGFTYNESRHALRSFSNLEQSIQFILEKREEKMKRRMEEEERRRERRQQFALGRTLKGNLVDMKLLQQLTTVFNQVDYDCVVEALIRSDNDDLAATQLLTSQLDDLQFYAEERIHGRFVNYERVYDLVQMGFQLDQIVYALKKHYNKTAPAIDDIMNGKAIPKIASKDLDDIAKFVITKATGGVLGAGGAVTETTDAEGDSQMSEQDAEEHPPAADSIFDQQPHGDDEEGDEEDDQDEEDGEEEEPQTPLDKLFAKKEETIDDIIDEEIIDTFHGGDSQTMGSADDDFKDELAALESYMSKLKK